MTPDWTDGLAKVEYGWNAATKLISPTVSIVEGSQLSFRWTSYYDINNFMMVKVSIDGGETWNTIWDWEDTNFFEIIGQPVQYTTIDLDEYAGYNVKIAFDYEQYSGGAKLYMDDVVIGSTNKSVGTFSEPQSHITYRDRVSYLGNRSDLTGFKVYRDDVEIAFIENAAARSYSDGPIEDGVYNYYLKAVYGEQLSEPSNSVELEVETNFSWLYHGSGDEYLYGFSRNEYGDYQVAADFIIPEGTTYWAQKLVTANYTELDLNWRIVQFDEVPTEITIGSLEGSITTTPATYNGQTLFFHDVEEVISDETPLTGHIAVVLDIPSIQPSTTDRNSINYQMRTVTGVPDGLHTWFKPDADSSWETLEGFNIGAWNIKLYVTNEAGVEEELSPNSASLGAAYPNPFNPTTSFNYFLSKSDDVKITVFNAKGEEVSILENGFVNSGSHSITFDAKDLNSGVYFYSLETSNQVITKKVILVK